MTAREMMDNLSETLMCDERILSVQERELLATLLQRTNNHVSARDNAVTEAIAHAVGEIIAQRTYAVLGQSITQRLIEQASASDSGTGAVVVHGGDPAPPKAMPKPLSDPAPPKSAPSPLSDPAPPKSMPRPLSDPAPPKTMPKPLSDPAPPKAMPKPLSDPAPPKAMPRPLSDPAPPKSTPRPLSDPAPPRSTASVTQVESHGVAVMERPDFLPAQFVVLDESSRLKS
jgi:hypothetical protein